MAQTPNASTLYRFLGIGLTLVVVVFLVGRILQPAPAGDDNLVPYAIAGVGLVILAFAQGFVRPRVPARAPGQTVETYWATSAITAQILRVWFLTEAAGLVTGAGYWATGHIAPATVMIFAPLIAYAIAADDERSRAEAPKGAAAVTARTTAATCTTKSFL